MSEVETPLREVRLQVAACFAIIMLSIDYLKYEIILAILMTTVTSLTSLFS